MNDGTTLRIEKELARAHQALYRAAALAEERRDQGLADDLYELVLIVGRLNVDLLTRARPRRITK